MSAAALDKNLRILVVDDNRSIHDDFRKILCSRVDNELDDVEAELFDSPKTTAKRPPFQVDSAFQGQEGLALAQKAQEQGRPYAVAFIDIRMPPGWDGVETTSRIWEVCPDLQIVICTAYSDYSWNEMAAKLSSPDRLVILKKPFDAVEVLQLAHALTEKWRLVQEVKSKMDHLETLVAQRTQVLQVEIAERRRAAEALRQSEERYHSLFQKNPLPTWLIDSDKTFVAVNEAATQKYGYTAAEFQAMHLKDIYAPDDLAATVEHLEAAGRAPLTQPLVARHRKKDGSLIFVEIVSQGITVDGRDLKVLVAEDITERKLAQDRIRDQAELLDLASDAIVVRDVEGRIQFWNKGAERLYGWTAAEAIGATMAKLFSQDDLRTLQSAEQEFAAKGEWNGELRKRTHSGQEIFVASRWTLVRDEQSRPRSILMINTDVTEKKKLETQFLRAQRMEGIGTLATGMAHDLNNILAPILMSAGTLRWDVSAKDKELAISRIETSVKRGAAIIQQVLTFGRGISGDRTPVQPAEIVEEVCKIVTQTFPKNISIHSELAKNLWPVMGDRTQIHQVLLNLCVNARDAMSAKGGKLSIIGRNIHLTQPKPALPSPAPAGPYVRLLVSDSGCGIPASDRERIFDPFFTTKEVGKGTGLGLSTVLGIVKSHRGFVTVSSEVEQGTTFEILLPASAEAASIIAPATPSELPKGAGETVLIVDDEPDIVSGMRDALQNQNYRVLVARNGREALDSVKASGEAVNVVVTDLMMPEMDGMSLIRGLRLTNPDLRIIASSGLTADAGGRARNQELLSMGVESFLSKPYTVEKLLTALHDLLHPSSRAAIPQPA